MQGCLLLIAIIVIYILFTIVAPFVLGSEGGIGKRDVIEDTYIFLIFLYYIGLINFYRESRLKASDLQETFPRLTSQQAQIIWYSLCFIIAILIPFIGTAILARYLGPTYNW